MAGLYVDVPDRRMPYDRDGTIGFKIWETGGAVAAMTSAELAAMNDEDSDSCDVSSIGLVANAQFYSFGLIFPELRDINAWWIHGQAAGWYDGTSHHQTTNYIDTSTDTTNGSDGTWTRRVASGWGNVIADTDCQLGESFLPTIKPTFRTGWRSALTTPSYALPWTGVKAVRWYAGTYDGGSILVDCLHLYGDTVEVCRITHPTLDAEVGAAWFDFAEVAQGETYVQTFRVKNTDGSRTATSIAVGTDVASDATTPLGPQFEYSIGGGAFSTSLNIGNLAAGAISGVITMRFTVAPAADLGLWAARVVANPASLV